MAQQPVGGSGHGLFHSGKFGQSGICKQNKYMQLHTCRHNRWQQVLAVAPRFHHQAAHTVAVHTPLKLLLGYREAGLHGGHRCQGGIGAGRDHGRQVVHEAYRKNRKRFPETEKRVNMLLALEPLISLKSMTDGEMFLKVKITSGDARQIQ